MSKSKPDTSLLSNEFNRKVLNIIGIVGTSLLIILLVLYGFRVILLVLGGILVATFFLGITDFITSKTPLKHTISLALVVLLVLGVFIGTSFLLAPQISEQVSAMSEQLPKAANKTIADIKSTEVGNIIIGHVEKMDMNAGTGEITRFFGSLFGTASTLYIILFLGIFFMLAPKKYVRGFVKLFPKTRRDRVAEIIETMGKTLNSWLLGKLLSMLIVGVLTGIGLVILDIPLALTLAIFAAFISFIPNFGPIIALIPAFLLAFTQNPSTALYVVLMYVGIQAVESNVLTPLIQKKMISFPMAMILIAQVVLGLFTGVLGVILAVPLVAVLVTLIKMAYIEDVLGDTSIDVKYENASTEK